MMLDIGLPVQHLAKAIRACLSGDSQGEELSVSAINRRGKAIVCNVSCTPMQGADDAKVRGVIVVMEEEAIQAPV